MKRVGLRVLVILTVDLILTSVFVLALAGLAYKMSWEDTRIGIGVAVIYILVNLVGGGLAGKAAKSRRFLWGALEGIAYFMVISLVAWLVTHQFYSGAASMLIPAAICAASGMVGGMLGRG